MNKKISAQIGAVGVRYGGLVVKIKVHAEANQGLETRAIRVIQASKLPAGAHIRRHRALIKKVVGKGWGQRGSERFPATEPPGLA
eukprot:1161774-Pelagomonas_calceolata.AAC.4